MKTTDNSSFYFQWKKTISKPLNIELDNKFKAQKI